MYLQLIHWKWLKNSLEHVNHMMHRLVGTTSCQSTSCGLSLKTSEVHVQEHQDTTRETRNNCSAELLALLQASLPQRAAHSSTTLSSYTGWHIVWHVAGSRQEANGADAATVPLLEQGSSATHTKAYWLQPTLSPVSASKHENVCPAWVCSEPAACQQNFVPVVPLPVVAAYVSIALPACKHLLSWHVW